MKTLPVHAKSRKIVIFGIEDTARLAQFYFEHDSTYEVVAFTVDQTYCKTETFQGLPLIPFEGIETIYPPAD